MAIKIPPPTQTVVEQKKGRDVDAGLTFTFPWYRAVELLANPIGTTQINSFTVTTLPSAATAGQFAYVSNESGGAVMAFSDGTNWRRVTDRAIVS